MRSLVLVLALAACGSSPHSDADAAIDIAGDGGVHHVLFVLFDFPTQIQIIDLDTHALVRSIPLGASLPAGFVQVSPDGKTAYFASTSTVEVLDLVTANGIGVAMPSAVSGLRLSPDGRFLYAVCGGSIGETSYVVKIDVGSRTIANMFKTAFAVDHVSSIDLTPDGSELVAGISVEGGGNAPLQFITTSTMGDDGQAAFNAACSKPRFVALTDTGRALDLDDQCDRIFQVDTATKMTANDIVNLNSPSGYFPRDIEYSTRNGHAYVTEFNDPDFENLYVVDLSAKTNTPVAGLTGPSQIRHRLSQDGSTLHVLSGTGYYTARTFDAIDIATDTVTQNVYTAVVDEGVQTYIQSFVELDLADLP